MNIHYKWTKCEPTPEIVAQAQKQVGGLARFAGEGARAELELEQAVGGKHKGDIWRAELSVITPTNRFRAESTKAKLAHALTTVTRDVSDQLRREKRKDSQMFRKGGASIKNFLRGFSSK